MLILLFLVIIYELRGSNKHLYKYTTACMVVIYLFVRLLGFGFLQYIFLQRFSDSLVLLCKIVPNLILPLILPLVLFMLNRGILNNIADTAKNNKKKMYEYNVSGFRKNSASPAFTFFFLLFLTSAEAWRLASDSRLFMDWIACALK